MRFWNVCACLGFFGCSSKDDSLESTAGRGLSGEYKGSHFELIGNENHLSVTMRFVSPQLADLDVHASLSWFYTEEDLDVSCSQVGFDLTDGGIVTFSSDPCMSGLVAAFNSRLPSWRQIQEPPLSVQYDLSSDTLIVDWVHMRLPLVRPSGVLTPLSPNRNTQSNTVYASDSSGSLDTKQMRLTFVTVQTLDLAILGGASCDSIAYWFGFPRDSNQYEVWIGLPSDPSRCLKDLLTDTGIVRFRWDPAELTLSTNSAVFGNITLRLVS